MTGMDAHTGRAIDGAAHLRQSVADIIMTPIGTRVGRRGYGSLVPVLLDQPANPAGRLRIFAAAAVAIFTWEPRLRATRMTMRGAGAPGAFELLIDGQRTDLPAPAALTQLTVPLVAGGILPA